MAADVLVPATIASAGVNPHEHHVGQLGVEAPPDVDVRVGADADDHPGVVNPLQIAALHREQIVRRQRAGLAASSRASACTGSAAACR